MVVKKRSSGLLVLFAVALLSTPVMIGQPSDELNAEILATEGSDITFYGRTWNFGADEPMPMNTQYPWGEDDYSLGTSGGCGNPPPAPDASADCENWNENQAVWFTTPGFIQVKSREEFTSYEQLHNERGQTKDIYFDTDGVGPISTLYMSADAHGWSLALCAALPCWNWDPGYFEDWVIETWIYHLPLGEWSQAASDEPNTAPILNNDPSVTLMAHGNTPPTDLVSFDETIPAPQCAPDCKTVHPFTQELTWTDEFKAQSGVVPFTHDVVVRFQWYQETNGQKYIIPQLNWNVNAGEDYPNNVVFPVRNPLDVELVFPSFIHERLVTLSVLNTPWGSYDVDLESIEIQFVRENGDVIVPDDDLFETFIDVSVAHSGHYDPINLVWIWDVIEQDIPPGKYDIIVSADNFQKSYTTETIASFTITNDGKAGETQAARSGLVSFDENQLGAIQTGADDVSGADDGPEEANTGGESKGTPGFGLATSAAVLAMAGMALRRRKLE